MPAYKLEPVWRTTFYHPPPTTPQQPQNLLRPTLMDGLSTSRLTGGGNNLVAGQFRGRVGNYVSGGCSSCGSAGVSGLGTVPDFKALQSWGQQYYQQGVDLYKQGDVWVAQAMEEFASLDMDPSQIDWQNIASRGIDASINWLANQLHVTPPSGEFTPPDLPNVASYDAFQSWLKQARSINGQTSPAQEAQATALALLQKKKEEAAMWNDIIATYSLKPQPGYPHKFKNIATGEYIWSTDRGKQALLDKPGFVLVNGTSSEQVAKALVAPLGDQQTLRYAMFGVLGIVGIGAAYFFFMR